MEGLRMRFGGPKCGVGQLQGSELLWVQLFRLFVVVWFLFLCRVSVDAQIYSYETNGSTFFYETNNGTIRIWDCYSGVG